MSEKTTLKDFAPAPQTADQIVLEQDLARLRMDRALGKDVDESEIKAKKDWQDVLANRPPEGSYQEYVDVEGKEPLSEGVFSGDVFYKDEKVYSITARREAGDQVMVTVVTAKNHEAGADETQLMTEAEARKLLAGAELVDSGADRENAAFTNGSEAAAATNTADNSGDSDDAGNKTNDSTFANVSADEQRARLRTVFGKDFIDQLSDDDIAKYAAIGADVDKAQPAAAPETVTPGADVDNKDLVDEQKTTPEQGTVVVDSDTNKKPSEEVLDELHMTSEKRKERDRQRLLHMYRNASSDEMRRISEIAWGKDSMHDYDEKQAYDVTDEEAVRYMLRAIENGYEAPSMTDLSQITGETSQDSDETSDDEAIEPTAQKGFMNRLRARWENMDNRRRKVARALTGVALTTIGIGGAYVLWKNGGDHSAVSNILGNGLPTGGGAKAAAEHASNDPQAGANLLSTLKDLHVSPGQGVYDVLAHNGIDKSKVNYAELYDLQRQFPKELYLQQVGNVTDVRITNPGSLSQPLADALAKFASK